MTGEIGHHSERRSAVSKGNQPRFHVLAQADRSRVLLLPLKGERPLFEGYLRLKDTPKGPRPFKFLVKKDSEKYLPPDDAVRMLRRARGIFVAPGDRMMEERFIELLGAYQLKYRRISVCNHCLGNRRITLLDKRAIRYKGGEICENCALDELRREADFRGLGRAARAHLARLLRRSGNLDDILALLSLERVDPELTRFDVMPATDRGRTMDIEAVDLPAPFKEILRSRLKRLMPVQALSVEAGLLEGKGQLVVSATATGKSLIGELAGVKNLMEDKGKLLFLVPLVALANQKFNQLSSYSCLGLSTTLRVGVSRIKLGGGKRMRRDLNADIIVGTYEGIDQVLRTKGALGKVGTVVIDEVHMLEDDERGHRLAGLIARMKLAAPMAQFIFLSATVGNPASLAQRLGVDLVEYAVRPIPIERHLIFTSGAEKRGLLRELVRRAGTLTSTTGYKGQTIVFTNSRKNCFALAESMPGASAYHAGLQYNERKRVEDLFAKGSIETVVTTAALAAGVDFPASQVIFESLAMGIEWLSVHEFNQMLGRAGRPGYQDRGLVYILAEPGRAYGGTGESEDEVALRLLKGQMEDVAPRYDEDQQLEEVLANAVAARSREDLERLHSLTPGLDDLDDSLKRLRNAGLIRGIEPTILGRAAAAHFLSPPQVEVIVQEIARKAPPLEVAVALEHFEAIFVKAAARISTALRMPISERALHGSYLDLISSGEFRSLDRKIQQHCLNFAQDFLRCSCKESPYCGCIEKKISLRILEMRMEGGTPSGIIGEFSDRYGLYAYQGDLINYLDQMVRYLEATAAVARAMGQEDAAREAARIKEKVEGE
ncbi:MAG: DEAD/DEAH box helicase [Methanotrichaceae archaeon]|nr:DEAD/DEAH box helicase [Methanotrichaceae archaeon]